MMANFVRSIRLRYFVPCVLLVAMLTVVLWATVSRVDDALARKARALSLSASSIGIGIQMCRLRPAPGVAMAPPCTATSPWRVAVWPERAPAPGARMRDHMMQRLCRGY